MRRFITSLTGKIFSHLVIVSLLASFLATTLISRATAQVQLLPLWAVTEFTTHNGLSQTYGDVAAQAISSELSGSAKYQMLPPDFVKKKIDQLNLTSPLEGTVNLLRVGQELRAQTIVTGDVIAAQINNVGGGKEARVAIRAVAYNVASGLPVNGAAVVGLSTVRNGSVTDDELIKDAIRAGSNQAIRQFQQHQLPTATVLNTLTDSCYFNAGTRAGFTGGQQVVITRGREEVATGHVTDLQPDEAVVVIERSFLGVAPGDHVSAIFPIPDISFDAPFAANGGLHTNRVAHTGNNAGLISLLVVAGLVGVLLGNGGNSQTVLNSVTAQASLFPPQTVGIPSVLVSWSPNAYAKGNGNLAAWQVWRSDVPNAPVAVTQGDQRSVYDEQFASGNDNQYTNWTFLNGIIGGTTCNTNFDNEAIPTILPSLLPGTPYVYQVELVYQLSSIDLPIVSSSGTTSGSIGSTSGSIGSTSGSIGSTSGSIGSTSGSIGSTGGGTTSTLGGGTTSGTTSTLGGGTGTTSGGTGTTSNGAETCYFLSPKQSSGVATPLNPPQIIAPTAGTSISPDAGVTTTFAFTGSARSLAIQIQYVIQFSLSPNFPNNSSQTFDYPQTITTLAAGGPSGANVSPPGPLTVFGTKSILPNSFQSAATVYWRVGARATADNPGPAPDFYTHQRYIFSVPSYFTQKGTVPTPPASRASGKTKTSSHRKS